MQVPLQITFRNMEPSEAVKTAIEKKATKLEDFHEHVTSCHVIVETPHRHHHQGRVHHVKVHLTLPGHEINIDHDAERGDHEDIYVSIRDAFEAAMRQLKDFTAKRAEHR